jgi:hypothetical protein
MLQLIKTNPYLEFLSVEAAVIKPPPFLQKILQLSNTAVDQPKIKSTVPSI